MAQNLTNLEEVKPAYLQQYGYSTNGAPVTSSQYIGSVQVQGATQQPIRGESRIEYIPYEKSVIEYEAVPKTEYVAREKKVVDHYAVEYQTEFIPQVYQDRYIEYVPTERVVERIEYTPVERQIVHQPQPEIVQQEVQSVPVQSVPVQYQAVVPQAVQYQPLTTSYVAAPALTASRTFVTSAAPFVTSAAPFVPQSFVRPGQFVPPVVLQEAKEAPKPKQAVVQQKPRKEGGEPGFLEMLFGTSNSQ